MKKIISFNLILLLLALISCTSPTATTENGVFVQTSDAQLKIFNVSNQTIHLFVVEREIAASINWRAGFRDSGLSKYESINIKYSDIYNGLNEPVKFGDEVIVYYWDESNKTKPKIYGEVVKI